MIGNYFRPWGELGWILPKLPDVKWDLISCLSTEDRFISASRALELRKILDQSHFFKIIDPPSSDSDSILAKLAANHGKLQEFTNSSFSIESHELLEPYSLIVKSVNSIIQKSQGSVIVDISTFPKRFFFPIIKVLLKSSLENLVVTYSTPEKYCSEMLSANPHSWDHLPLFMPVGFPETPIDVGIVGVGFMPFGLPDLLLSTYSATPVKFLFPFPPGPPNYQRTWDFVRKIEKSFTFKTSDSIIKIDANNMPDVFGFISKETDSGRKKALFAPYGPKPFSLAMCLHATIFDSPVYYTQPTHYNLAYSTGTKETYAYPIIINKKNLFS